jgi:outer membrane protein assembly factor BamB
MDRRKAWRFLLVILLGLVVPGSVWGAAGDPLWEQQFTFLPQYDTITINYAALSSTTYILAGNAYTNGAVGQVGFIKAFDVATGTIKWDKTLSLGTTGNNFGLIAINGDIAIVKGSYISASGSTMTLNKSLMRAYNADTGQLLWEVLHDFEGMPITNGVGITPTLTANNRVFTFAAAMDTSGILNASTVFVRAYQVRNITMPSMLLLEQQLWPASPQSQGK